MNKLGIILAALGVFFCVRPVSAGAITVNNSDFQTLPNPAPTFIYNPQGYFDEAAVPGWTSSDTDPGFAGQWYPNDTAYVGATGTNLVAYTNSSTLSQTVGTTVATGDVYTLTVLIGWRYPYPYDAGADLLVNGTQYEATPNTAPAQGYFTTYTATYTGLSTDLGDSITIELTSAAGFEGSYSDVTLNDTPFVPPTSPTPEPATFACLSIGLLALGAKLRKRLAKQS